MAYTVKSLRQIDGNHTHLLFVKGASPISVSLISAVAHDCPLRKPDMFDESKDENRSEPVRPSSNSRKGRRGQENRKGEFVQSQKDKGCSDSENTILKYFSSQK